MNKLLVGSLLLLVISGCQAAVGTSAMISVPKDAAGTCTNYCSEMGLTLSSVVIMANNVGCVCSPKTAAPSAAQASGAAAGGLAAILIAEQQQQSQPVRN